ncbi:ABC-2 family transporter protein [Mariprofundus ferrinatatus]|uniref:ABC-2 family transporter protein n=2 Tax=Mariprofundus ferrinatatus TaxID=1921087 RepID=A0A2K8LA81_9PROT|nr:ABC-2 family transporter protein [Mariprofundus ferrinatatus]
MNQLFSLIWFTLKEMAGQRIYKTILLTLIIIPWLMLIPTSLFMLDLGKVFMDMLFASQHAWLSAYLFFLAVPLLARDIEQGICSIFLTLPMSREKYLWGRFIGVVSSILPLLVCYISSSIAAFIWAESTWPVYVSANASLSFSFGSLLILMPYLALAAILFLIAAGATGSAEITVFLFSIWLICWSLPPVLDAMQSSEVAKETPAWIGMLLHSINQLLPDLSSSQISLRLAHSLPLSASSVISYCLQHIAYAAVAIMAATAVFNRRDLK